LLHECNLVSPNGNQAFPRSTSPNLHQAAFFYSSKKNFSFSNRIYYIASLAIKVSPQTFPVNTLAWCTRIFHFSNDSALRWAATKEHRIKQIKAIK